MAVHGRTREAVLQSGQADWDIIARVKDAVSIPVIGNGDIRTPLDAERMMKETGCDGVMIGRAARGNPWIFHQMKTYFETGVLEERPPFEVVCQTIMRHARMQVEWKGEKRGMMEMRTHVASYTGGYPHSGALRRAMNEIETLEELQHLLGV